MRSLCFCSSYFPQESPHASAQGEAAAFSSPFSPSACRSLQVIRACGQSPAGHLGVLASEASAPSTLGRRSGAEGEGDEAVRVFF